ncbi:hypothetical protein I6G96_17230 [Delftia acidovorans]|uniref:hypothetical protein n=1 Tax=Delftia acidovorans TaxID=80866 RepID=UPI0018D8379F|nr:hypothetical protein [Delftia acidovorans]QPR32725.1 hypothetical protein I6G96_17230 [Delftia acidovorans]
MKRLKKIMKAAVYIIAAALGFQIISLLIFLRAPMKIDLSDIEGFNLSYIFNKLGNPDYDLSVKDILGWQSHRCLIRQNVVIRIKESNIKPTAFPASISVTNTLGEETHYFKLSKHSRSDGNNNFIRTTTITVWPYGDFLISKEIVENKNHQSQ